MKYHEDFPDGTEIDIEIEPMTYEKFCAVCVTLCVIVVAVGVVLAVILR